MAIIVVSEDAGKVCAENIAIKVAEWIRKCEKTIDFVYNHEPRELSVLEALQGNPKLKICDPYGYISISESPLNTKVEKIETHNGKPLKSMERISGHLTVNLTSGEELAGRWVDGKREGRGILIGPRLEKNGVECVHGMYEDGILTGLGKVIMQDGSIREGWFQHGYFHGPTRGSYRNACLNFIGHYKAGLPSGMVWTSVRGGGWIVGCVDSDGRHSGFAGLELG